VINPDSRSCSQLKFCTLINFRLRCKFVPRHCANAHLSASCNRDSFPAIYQTCTATRVMLNKLCTRPSFAKATEAKRRQKHPAFGEGRRAIPSLHRDRFLAKVPGPCPVLASGNIPYLSRYASGTWMLVTLVWRRRQAPSLKQPTGLFLNARPFYCRAVGFNVSAAVENYWDLITLQP